MRTKRFLQILTAITVIAFLVRLFVCILLHDTPEAQNPNVQTDMATYLNLARGVLAGNWPDHYDYQPFYYTIFLPPLLAIGANSLVLVMGVQALFASIAVHVTGLATAQLYGRKAGLLAAALLALARFHACYTPFLLFEVLNSFWLALLFYLLLRSWKRNTWTLWLLAALTLSAAALTRGNALLFLPGILCLIIWRNHRQWLRGIAIAAVMLVIFYLPQLPFSIVNYRYTGRWCGPSTAGDKVLALGNTPEAPPGGLEYPLIYHEWCKDSDKRPEDGRISVPAHIIGWFKESPSQVIELQFRKFLLFWHRQEIPNNVNLNAYVDAYPILKLLLPFWVLAIPAVGALFTCWRCSPKHLLLFFLVLVYSAGTILFYILARFRIGIIPLLCILAAAFVKKVVDASRGHSSPITERERQRLLLLGLAAVTALWIVCSAFTFYQDHYEASVIRSIRPNGIAVRTEDTILLYDHGPFTIGGLQWVNPLDKGTLEVSKTIVIPASDRERFATRPVTVRIPFLCPIQGTPFTATFRNGAQAVTPSVVQARFMRWLEASFESLSLNEDGTATVALTLNGSSETAIGIDRLRDYGRTQYLSNGSPLPLLCEAAIELQVQH